METYSIDSQSVIYQFKGTPAEKDRVKLLGIRGYFKDMGLPGCNDMGIYDDLICRVIDNEVVPFRASTDPGSYYLDHPINPQGCALLRKGFWTYKLGLHLNTHEALVQADEVLVDRINSRGDACGVTRGWFGINIHSGGPEYEVGRYSAGCQVIYSPEGAWNSTWQRFFLHTKDALEKYEQSKVRYLLVDNLKAMPAV